MPKRRLGLKGKMDMLKMLNALKEKMMEKMEKKHIKKLKPQTSQPATFGAGNGGNPCPPVGGDILATNN
jgi:hypothetical protein